MEKLAFMVLPVLVCVACAIHSRVVRGREITWIFFLCAIVFSELRGLVDTQRPISDMPQISRLGLWVDHDRDKGLFLIVMPAVRTAIAYLALLVAERRGASRGAGAGPGGALRMCAVSLLTYSVLGMLVESGGELFGWWVYQALPDVNPGLFYHLIKGMNWGGGIFQAFFLASVASDLFERPTVVAVNYMLGYFLGLTICTLVMPALRTLVFGPFNLAVILIGLSKQGPTLRPLRVRSDG